MGQLQRLYYDTALSTSEFVFASAERVRADQRRFCSAATSRSWRPEIIAAETAGIENSQVFDDETRAAIDRGNALAAVP